MKKVLKASVNKLMEFDDPGEFEKHVTLLKSRKRGYVILSEKPMENGKIQVEIKEQYNNNDLL